MQLRHVSTNLRQGLRRNLSMHAAVILTLFVSLSLVGIGLLLSQQATRTADVLGTELQITVSLCVPDEPAHPECVTEVTAAQEAAIVETIEENPEVADYEVISKEQGFEDIKDLGYEEQLSGPDPIVNAEAVPKQIRITLKDPDEDKGVISAVADLDGVRDVTTARELVGPVFTIIDILRGFAIVAAVILVASALMLVANTIRLAALARRKEIEIMRLVGASRLFIALPFLLESLFNAVVSVALASGALAAFVKFGIIDRLAEQFDGFPFIGWPEYVTTVGAIGVLGLVITVLPTLLLTRKYLKY